MFITGDVLFSKGENFISRGIKFVTRSDISHTGIFFSEKLIFETYINTNARLNFFNREYRKKDYTVLRPKLTAKETLKVQVLCEKYDKSKYSKWDIVTNLAFAWLPPKARRKTVSFLGSKKMMICSEITSRILFEVNPKKFHYLSGYEGLRPDGLFNIGLDYGWGIVK